MWKNSKEKCLMKYKFLPVLLVLCLILAACGADQPDATGNSTAAPAGTTAAPNGGADPGGVGGLLPDGTLAFQEGGQCEVPYSVNMSAVHYITSADMLPEQEELETYTESWFADHALLLIYETVRNPSLEVGVDSIALDGGQATVTLYHRPGENPSTTRLMTWLLWVEVDQGLECTWEVGNPAEESDVSPS